MRPFERVITAGARHNGPRIQRWIGYLLWYSGVIALARYCQRRRGTARILAYHHILPAGTQASLQLPWTMYTDAGAFARQMRYVARHYHPIALPEMVERLARGESMEAGTMAITLDDGYEDQVIHAIPILRACGLPATLNVITGCVSTTPDLAEVTASDASGDAAADTWGRGERFASLDQLRAIQADGVSLASHSVSHRDLTTCAPHDLEVELIQSQELLRALGAAGDLLCYPGGMHNRRVRAAVAAAGYRAALSCEPGANSARTDPLALRRVLVGASPDEFVAAQLAGLLDGPAWVFHLFNRVHQQWRRRRR